MYENNRLLRAVDPNSLYPGIRVYDRDSHREGEIIKIEYSGRGMPDILVVFDGSDRPVNSVDYPGIVILEI